MVKRGSGSVPATTLARPISGRLGERGCEGEKAKGKDEIPSPMDLLRSALGAINQFNIKNNTDKAATPPKTGLEVPKSGLEVPLVEVDGTELRINLSEEEVIFD